MVVAEFTSAAFVRSHGKEPRGVSGGHGHWAFQRTSKHTAFSHELEAGNPIVVAGTLSEAKKQLVSEHGAALWAVLP